MDRLTIPDVLTLEETSAYLRLSIETVTDQALKGNIPGRKIENDWRFLNFIWLLKRLLLNPGKNSA